MSLHSKDEGAGVAPQNKGSWSTFLKVSRPTITHGLDRTLPVALVVNSIFQWRPLVIDCSSLHFGHHVPHRILGVLDRASLHLRCASVRAGSGQTGAVGTKMVLDHLEAAIQ